MFFKTELLTELLLFNYQFTLFCNRFTKFFLTKKISYDIFFKVICWLHTTHVVLWAHKSDYGTATFSFLDFALTTCFFAPNISIT